MIFFIVSVNKGSRKNRLKNVKLNSKEGTVTPWLISEKIQLITKKEKGTQKFII
ncbi:hypothetical protein GCM10008932_05270 [Alkalibacterium iburiense]|uniref:Uncharacterized protein n=1 Tax=Alkalibacterium iburiense TaxID=290589 RepID=A0ABN0X553_9LACT